MGLFAEVVAFGAPGTPAEGLALTVGATATVLVFAVTAAAAAFFAAGAVEAFVAADSAATLAFGASVRISEGGPITESIK